MTDESGTASAHVVGTAGDGGRNLLGRVAVAAIEAAVRDAVAPVEAPDLRQHRLDRVRREDAHAVERSAVEQHAPDACQPARRDAQAALRREERAVLAQMPARQIAGLTVLHEHRAVRPLAVQIVLLRLARRIVELDRAGDDRVAAGWPIVAGVEPHRLEHFAAHPDVEPLARHLLNDRADDGEVEVGVAEVIIPGAVLRVPILRIGH